MGQKDENEVANVQANEDVDVKERAPKETKEGMSKRDLTFHVFSEYLSINTYLYIYRIREMQVRK